MKSTKKIKSLIQNINVHLNPRKDQEILNELLNAHAQSKQLPWFSWMNAWRTIMQSRITIPAVIVGLLAIVVSVSFLNRSAQPAYGLLDALHIYKNTDTCHMRGYVYEMTKKNGKQKLTKYPIEHWFDFKKGCYKLTKPLVLQRSGENKIIRKSITVSDGEYIMHNGYFLQGDDRPKQSIHFTRLTKFKARLLSHRIYCQLFNGFFGCLDQIKGFSRIGSEIINGHKCDIWEGTINIGAEHGKLNKIKKIKSWLSPKTGRLHRFRMWRSQKENGQWIPMIFMDQIELNTELPADIFKTEPPEGAELDNTKENAPEAEMAALCGSNNLGCGDINMYIYIGFTLKDGSMVLCWQSTDKNQPAQNELFKNLNMGGDLPELPVKIEALKPILHPEMTYKGYHLTHTRKNNRFYEWSIYVSPASASPRNRIIGYRVMSTFNVDLENKHVGTRVMNFSNDIAVDTEEDFNTWLLGAMKETNAGNKVPNNIAYSSVLELASKLRAN
jgi:hypothetical protein